MPPNRRTVGLLVGLLLVVSVLAWAGSLYTWQCKQCQFNGKSFYGTGLQGRVLACGYCAKCEKFVGVNPGAELMSKNLTREELKAAYGKIPQSVEASREFKGHVYCPMLSGKRAVFACPGCEGLVLDIKQADWPRDAMDAKKPVACPKCGEQGLSQIGSGIWD